jgi:predicted GTPase
VFVSALEGRGRLAVMHQVIETYEKWCFRLSTSRLNRWLRKVNVLLTLLLLYLHARVCAK